MSVGWSILMICLATHEIRHIHSETRKLALNEVHTHLKKDQALRYWIASHGGVYVPISARTQPSKYLSHVPERDIQTPSEKHLTLMNPGYVIRQIGELYADLYGVRGHLTSLKLLRPENVADSWEKKALAVVEQQGRDFSEFVDIDEKPFLRYMQPMKTESSCLKCHASQGYQEGDIQGGVSVSVPMAEYLLKERQECFTHLLSYVLMWIVGLGIIWLGGRRLVLSVQERDQAHEDLLRHKEHLEEVVGKRTVELTEANQKLEYLSITDGLTTVANRRCFDDLIHKEWERALRKSSPIALIMVDIDCFKSFNDSYGHQKGDMCLKKVAMVLHGEMKRTGDFVARYGGEEFAIVLPDTDKEGALSIADQINENIANLHIEHTSSTVSDQVTISMGVNSVVPRQDSTVSGLIQRADKALYSAKAQGRNQIRFFSNNKNPFADS